MPAVQLLRTFEADKQPTKNPLPELLHTPVGLAVIEIQGTIHAPNVDELEPNDESRSSIRTTHVGQLEFPLHDGSSGEGPWMKRVYLYIGKHQRLVGEVRRLPKPLVVLSKNDEGTQAGFGSAAGQLSIDAIVKHKILFASRPEPVDNR